MMDTLPHIALIYTDTRNRNQLLKSIVEPPNADWNSVVVLSSNPKVDALFFKGKEWKETCRRARPVSSIDMKRIVGGKHEPANDVIRTTMKSLEHRPEDSAPLVVGDWFHQVYNRFEVGLAVERHHTLSKVRNMICCYRGEGFWSLDVIHLARVFDLHDRVIFGTTIFDSAEWQSKRRYRLAI
jgi:hypothetical protein